MSGNAPNILFILSEWLQERASLHAAQPFMLTVGFDKPHFPVNPPKRYFNKYIGRVLGALDSLGFADNTIVVYSADHGDMAYQNGAWQKTVFYDNSARVPFLVRWPEQVAAGSRCGRPVGLIDLFPTFCEAAGLGIPAEYEGLSLLPLLTGRGGFGRDAIFPSRPCSATRPTPGA